MATEMIIPDANAPRVVQRLYRVKLAANKMMDRINNPDLPDSKKVTWRWKLQEYLADIAAMEHEAAAVIVRAAMEKGGVNIEVPVANFGFKKQTPKTPKE